MIVILCNVAFASNQINDKKMYIYPNINTIKAALTSSHVDYAIPTESTMMPIVEYPIHSRMTPGGMKEQIRSTPYLSQPLFLIGSDRLSYTWAKTHATKLHSIKAIGFLVEAESERDYQRMKAVLNNIPLITSSADTFLDVWHLQHYPVLITSNSISQ